MNHFPRMASSAAVVTPPYFAKATKGAGRVIPARPIGKEPRASGVRREGAPA